MLKLKAMVWNIHGAASMGWSNGYNIEEFVVNMFFARTFYKKLQVKNGESCIWNFLNIATRVSAPFVGMETVNCRPFLGLLKIESVYTDFLP